ncbi:MAG: peptide-methionine (S)-S-oxide reductase MsrA [Planctomycetota bacterium]|nr:peptide-methionine (S)-S-oxide reductase MsrA [Planctomycetota bacterium]
MRLEAPYPCALLMLAAGFAFAAESGEPAPAAPKLQTATFALGCFWKPDARFGSLKGVVRTQVGYSGGTKEKPTYHDLGDHSEVVQVEFDPAVVSYEYLLKVFWTTHNPCARVANRQYRASIYFQDEEQQRLAEASRETLAKELKDRKITTEIRQAGTFWRAEEYHQKYYLRQIHPAFDVFEAVFRTDRPFADATISARANGLAGHFGTVEDVAKESETLDLSPENREKLLDALRAYLKP